MFRYSKKVHFGYNSKLYKKFPYFFEQHCSIHFSLYPCQDNNSRVERAVILTDDYKKDSMEPIS